MIIRTKRLLLKIITLLFGLVLLISFLFLKKTGFLTIQKIEVKADFRFENQKKTEQPLKFYLGKSFFFNDDGKLLQEIKNQEIKIESVALKKEFPDKLILLIKKRQPLMVIPRDNAYFFVDREGMVFSLEKTAENWPFLIIELQKIEIGSRIEIGKIKIPQILAALGQVRVDKIIVKDNQVQLVTGENCLIILPREIANEKIEALQMILNRFRIEGKRLIKIDLRFEKPVVSF